MARARAWTLPSRSSRTMRTGRPAAVSGATSSAPSGGCDRLSTTSTPMPAASRCAAIAWKQRRSTSRRGLCVHTHTVS
jgi:hypothetical protein